MSKHLANPEEKKKVKIVRKDTPSMNPNLSDSPGSTEYIKGGRRKKDGSREKSRSVEIGKDFQGDSRKTVRKTKKDGSVETKSKKISDKRAERIKKRKDKKYTTISNYGTMKTPYNMGAPNFYVMEPGSAAKKMDTPGGFSYKASTTMNKLGFVDSGINDGHAPLDKKVRYDEFGTEIPEGFKSSTGQDYEISVNTGKILGEKTRSGARGRGDSVKITSAANPNKPAEFKKGDSITRTSDGGNKTSRTTFLSDTKKFKKPGTPSSTFKQGKQYLTETDVKEETLKIKPYKA